MATNQKKKKEMTQDTAQKIDPSEQLIPFTIPIDPAQSDSQQFYEVCINGEVSRYPRGEILELPRYMVEFILERDAIARENRKEYAAFSFGAGAEVG